MKKLVSALCLIAVLVSLFAPVGALASAADKNQVTRPDGTIYYDANGEEVEGASSLGGSAIVSVKKSATQHKDASGNPIENQFLMELQVRTTQKLLELSSGSPDAAVTLILDVSSSMTECIYCGHRQTESCHTGNNKKCNQYKSRMSETQAAANAFLDSFAKMGIDAGETNPPRRMVSIVTFDMDAEVHKVLNQTYIDVSNSSNLAAAKSVINGLKNDSGTNIEGGLRLARNIMTEARKTNGAIAGIDYLYTILLSDGEPSACIYPETNANRNNLTKIEGEWDNDGNSYGDYSTNYEDINEVVSEVNNIKAFSSQSRFFSICLGREINHNNSTTNATLQMKPFSNWDDLGLTSNTTIEQWLKSFSTAVFGTNAQASADNILGNFNSVMSQIQLAAQAWRVEDIMGPDVDYVSSYPVTYNNQTINNVASYDQSTDTLTWNLLQSATDPRISSSSTTNAILGYTFRYIVELDNLKSGYSHTGEHATNTKATLDYAVKKDNGEWSTQGTLDKPFFEPQVESYTGSLTFKKVDNHGNPVKGMTFTIDTPEDPSFSRTVTSDLQTGVVTFSSIPSGHAYHLHEHTIAGYAPVGELHFDVNWAQTNITEKTGVFYKDGSDIKLVNNITEHDNNPLNLTINKEFYIGSTKLEADDPLLANAAAAYAQFELDYPATDKNDHFYLNGNGLSASYLDLNEGVHTITEIAESIPGYALVRTEITAQDQLGNGPGNTAFTISTAGKTVSFDAVRDPALAHNYTVNYKNVYRQLTGSVSVRKSFEAHSLDTHTCDPNAGAFPGNTSGVTATVALYKANELTGEPYATITLSSANNWTGTFANVPAGDYVIRETSVSGNVTDYDFAHGRFVSVVKNNQTTALDLAADTNTYRFTVADGDRYGFNLENHYEREHGRLSVFKNINLNDGTQDNDASDADRFVDLYQQQNNGANPQITVNVYAGSSATGTPVATLTLHEGNGWQGTTGALPTGAYTIAESTPPALNGYELAAAASSTVTITEAHHQEPLSATLTNTYTRQTGSIKISKAFSNADFPRLLGQRNIPVQIVRTSDRELVRTVYLNYSNNWTAIAEDIPFDEYELIEVISSTSQDSAYLPDYSLKAQWSYVKQPADASRGPAFVTEGNWAAAEAADADISRVITNTYSDEVHDLTLKKVTNIDIGSLPAGYAVSINFERMVPGSTTQVDPSFELRRLMLNAANGFTATAHLPSGSYKLSETVTNAPEGYINTPVFTLINGITGQPSSDTDHIHFDMINGILTVDSHEDAAHSTLQLNITNNYKAEPATLTVRKSFAGQLDWNLFNTRVFYVDLYVQNASGQDTLVETLELKKNSDSDDPLLSFVATVDNLSADKTYYLVERNYDLPNYTDTVHWQMGSQNLTDYTNRDTSLPFTLQPGSSVTAVVTNTYNRVTGGLTVQKAYDFGSGESASDEAIAASTVTLTFTPKDGGQIGQKVPFSVTLTGAASVSRTNIPAGTYVVTESNANTLVDYTHTSTTYKIDGGSAQTGSAEVTIPEGENASVSVLVTNTYSRNTAKLTLSKTFSGDLTSSLVDSVTFSIEQSGKKAASVRVNAGTNWQGEAVLPTGAYTITETVTLKANAPYALTNYTHTPVWTSSIAANSGSSMTSDGGVATVVLGNGDHADVDLSIDNKYDFISGTITVTKDVAGVLTENDAAFAGKEFFVDVYNAEGEKQGDTLRLNKDNNFDATTGKLAANQYYYLVESGAPGIQDFTHTTQWLFANGGAFSDAENPAKSASFLLQTNAHAAFTVRNTYARENGQPLSISKQFVFSDGAAVDVSAAKVSVTFTPENPVLQGDPVTVELTGTAAQTVTLPVGVYTLSEDSATVNDFEDYAYSGVRF